MGVNGRAGRGEVKGLTATYLAAHIDWSLHENILRQRVVVCLSLGHGKHAGSRYGGLHSYPMLLAPAMQLHKHGQTARQGIRIEGPSSAEAP